MQTDATYTLNAGPSLNQAMSMTCGAFAGLAVDMTLYPLDTLKTRLQSDMGFRKAGGFTKIYAGIPSIMIGSAPGAALFFTAYDGVKHMTDVDHPLAHAGAAICGETVACLIRVPTDVIKQNSQARPNFPIRSVFAITVAKDGFGALYRGFTATIAREIPFALIEMPLWESIKKQYSQRVKRGQQVRPHESAMCGCVAGAVAASVTTPLDVVRTRIMLAERLYGDSERPSIKEVFRDVYQTHGVRGLFAGIVPRTIWMALGGFVFFGAYELVKSLLTGSGTDDNSVRHSRSSSKEKLNFLDHFILITARTHEWLNRIRAKVQEKDGLTVSERAKHMSYEERIQKEANEVIEARRRVLHEDYGKERQK